MARLIQPRWPQPWPGLLHKNRCTYSRGAACRVRPSLQIVLHHDHHEQSCKDPRARIRGIPTHVSRLGGRAPARPYDSYCITSVCEAIIASNPVGIRGCGSVASPRTFQGSADVLPHVPTCRTYRSRGCDIPLPHCPENSLRPKTENRKPNSEPRIPVSDPRPIRTIA
jgi:hypothetical protein